MKDHGRVRSTVQPSALEIDEYSVWVNTEITPVSEPGTDEEQGFTGFEFSVKQYDKDEFILKQAEENAEMQTGIDNTMLALTEVYEMLG